jgi:hypothetical protein
MQFKKVKGKKLGIKKRIFESKEKVKNRMSVLKMGEK